MKCTLTTLRTERIALLGELEAGPSEETLRQWLSDDVAEIAVAERKLTDLRGEWTAAAEQYQGYEIKRLRMDRLSEVLQRAEKIRVEYREKLGLPAPEPSPAATPEPLPSPPASLEPSPAASPEPSPTPTPEPVATPERVVIRTVPISEVMGTRTVADVEVNGVVIREKDDQDDEVFYFPKFYASVKFPERVPLLKTTQLSKLSKSRRLPPPVWEGALDTFLKENPTVNLGIRRVIHPEVYVYYFASEMYRRWIFRWRGEMFIDLNTLQYGSKA